MSILLQIALIFFVIIAKGKGTSSKNVQFVLRITKLAFQANIGNSSTKLTQISSSTMSAVNQNAQTIVLTPKMV